MGEFYLKMLVFLAVSHFSIWVSNLDQACSTLVTITCSMLVTLKVLKLEHRHGGQAPRMFRKRRHLWQPEKDLQ